MGEAIRNSLPSLWISVTRPTPRRGDHGDHAVDPLVQCRVRARELIAAGMRIALGLEFRLKLQNAFRRLFDRVILAHAGVPFLSCPCPGRDRKVARWRWMARPGGRNTADTVSGPAMTLQPRGYSLVLPGAAPSADGLAGVAASADGLAPAAASADGVGVVSLGGTDRCSCTTCQLPSACFWYTSV